MHLGVGKFKYLTVAIFALAVASWAQVPSGEIKWKSVKGSGDEFFVYFPEGFKSTQDGDFLLSSRDGSGVKVERLITVFRYVEGVALILEYYEGDAKGLQNSNRPGKEKKVKRREIGDFAFQEAYDDSKDGLFARIQHFRIKNRLYVLKSTKKPEESEIAKAFFESVRLTKNGQLFGPNFTGSDHSKVDLPAIRRNTLGLGNQPFEEKDVDRLPVPLNKSRMKVVLGQGQGRVKVRVRISADGLVENPEVITAVSAALKGLAVEAAQSSFFVPSERKGVSVPVQKVLEFEFYAPFNPSGLVPARR